MLVGVRVVSPLHKAINNNNIIIKKVHNSLKKEGKWKERGGYPAAIVATALEGAEPEMVQRERTVFLGASN